MIPAKLHETAVRWKGPQAKYFPIALAEAAEVQGA